MAQDPSPPPRLEDRAIRSNPGKGFVKFLGSHVYIGASFATLFILLFAGTAYLLLKQDRIEGEAQANTLSPSKPAPPAAPEFREIVRVFERNQTITQALAEHGLPGSFINELIETARPDYNLAMVKAGYQYWIKFAPDGKFRDFRYPIDGERYLTVYHDVAGDRLVSVLKKFAFETRVETVSGVIEDSLFGSVSKAGEQDQLAIDLSEIFGSDIDFHTDLQSGDWFRVLVEKQYLDGQFRKYGAILAAAFSNNKKLLAGFRFLDNNGKPAYFAPDGRSLKRSFLKSPLKFARVTSKFSYARRHPILKTVRPHLGVDYAAQAGTPVQAVGSGKVTSAGYAGANGKMVRIRHAGGYESAYLHLSRIAVKQGAQVNQGQVIGYVGSTGLSTGPHLDFRLSRNGKPLNPLKVIFPPGEPVSKSSFDEFAALRDRLSSELNISGALNDSQALQVKR